MLHHERGQDHWSALGDDPMEASLIEARRTRLRSLRNPPVPDRAALPALPRSGSSGCSTSVWSTTRSDSDRTDAWLHGQLAEVAAEILGVDVVPAEIEALRSRGFDVACMDVTTGERPDGRWDLIVAGELLEHLGHPGGLFDAAADLLADDGVFVLTTPNPYATWRVVQNLRGRRARTTSTTPS